MRQPWMMVVERNTMLSAMVNIYKERSFGVYKKTLESKKIYIGYLTKTNYNKAK